MNQICNSIALSSAAGWWASVLTFDEAVEQHSMVKEAIEALGTDPSSKIIILHAQDAWNQCMGVGDETALAAVAVRTAIPLAHIPLMCMRSGIPAAYFIVKFIAALADARKEGWALDDDFTLRECVKTAFEQFEQARMNADQIGGGFGCGRGEAWAMLRKVVDRSGEMNHTMKKILSLAGRMFNAFGSSAIPRLCSKPENVTGIEQGGDLGLILDDEAASVGVDPDAVVRVSEDRALQFQMTSVQRVARGPLVICVDESGSMDGIRNEWAKGCAIALARLALGEGRSVRVVHFSTACDIRDIRPGEPDDLRMLAESAVDGGTNIGNAARVAISQCGDFEAKGQSGADIVFITDGVDNYGREPFEEMLKRGIRLWTVAIEEDLKKKASNSRSSCGVSGGAWLYTYADAYVFLDDAILRSNGAAAINAAVELKQAALANP